MIYTGWALVDRAVTTDFIEVEAEAKRQKRGLWRYSFKAPPWPESDQ
jgi:endonuclease YncB( thermonuclease family)